MEKTKHETLSEQEIEEMAKYYAKKHTKIDLESQVTLNDLKTIAEAVFHKQIT